MTLFLIVSFDERLFQTCLSWNLSVKLLLVIFDFLSVRLIKLVDGVLNFGRYQELFQYFLGDRHKGTEAKHSDDDNRQRGGNDHTPLLELGVVRWQLEDEAECNSSSDHASVHDEHELTTSNVRPF